MSASEKYPLSLRILHWLMALMIFSLFIAGLVMDGLPRGTPLRDWVFYLHKSFGVTVLVLVVARLIIRLKSHIPALPEAIPALEKKMAHMGHLALYGFMFAIPLSGIVMTNSFGFAAPWFGLELPRLVGTDRTRGHMVGEWHEWLAWAIVALALLHVAGAIKHYVKERINLFKRMM